MATVMEGRAEYETGIFKPFEGVSPKYLLAPLFSERMEQRRDYFHPKMVIGARGCGKTYLLKSLAQSLSKDSGAEIFYLDKIALEDGLIKYDKRQWGRKPIITVVDDLHFLVKMMQVSKAIGGSVEENGVLKILERFRNYAKGTDMIQTFVSDEGPSGLAMRFEEENRKRFLELFDGCIDTSSDSQYFRAYLGKHYTSRANVVNLDSRGCMAQYRDLEVPHSVALDIFFEEIFCQNEMYCKNYVEALEKLKPQYGDKAGDELEKKKKEFKENIEVNLKGEYWYGGSLRETMSDIIEREMKEVTDRFNISISRELGMVGVPYAFVNSFDQERRIFYETTEDGFVNGGTAYLDIHGLERSDADVPIATIRELKVASKKLGGLNRKVLGLGMEIQNFPRKGRTGVVYSIREILSIRKTVLEAYRKSVLGGEVKVAGQADENIAWLYIDDDNMARAAMIDKDLRLEVP